MSINLIYKFTESSDRIASFDLDGTLIKTISGNKFPKNKDDYKYAFDNVNDELNKLIETGFKIVIFTNQKGISTGKTNKQDIISKIEKLFPFADYFISTKDDLYRKPMIGMFDFFKKINGDIKDIFYVGDAAGRKGDHSYADINFAYNSNIDFYTETQYFNNSKETVKHYCPKIPKKYNNINDIDKYVKDTVIIMQGFPASGKSTFVRKYVKYYKIVDNHIHLSNDEYTPAQFKKTFIDGIKNNKVIFIDNLNATKQNRKDIINLLPNHFKIIGIHITTNEEISKSLNKQRYYISNIETDYKGKVYKKIPYVVYNVYKKRFKKLELNEGFNKIYEYTPKIKLKYCFV